MLFFQSILVVGYVYAHLSSKYLSVLWQIVLHLGLWAIALAFLPISVRLGLLDSQADISVRTTLLLFAFGVGVPFAVLSANAPLIQKWYSKTTGPSADDPYFLYSASNIGSLMALLAFPFLAEPYLGAKAISGIWSVGFILLGLFLGWAGVMAWRTKKPDDVQASVASVTAPTLGRCAYWVMLAAIPSSLMLAVTSKISTDIGSFPLVWIIPLSLYLLTFIIAFSGRKFLSQDRQKLIVVACLIGLLTPLILAGSAASSWTNFAILIVAFFLLTLIAHKRIYDTRPHETHLTQFYILISIGGALGGFFNSIIATNLFNDIHEMPIVIALASILIWSGNSQLNLQTVIKPAFWAVLCAAAIAGLGVYVTANQSSLELVAVLRMLVFAAILIFAFLYQTNEWKAVTAIGVFIALVTLSVQGSFVFRDRSFFGVHRVAEHSGIRFYSNGTTVHGAQMLSDANTKPTPLTYYSEFGPMGRILNAPFAKGFDNVGIVGLGVGSLVCYQQPNQKWRLYEIDPVVLEIAENPALFTFMSGCADTAETYLGDGRLVLEQQSDNAFDVLVIDAFSSDAIPVHLITVEAIQIYMDQLTKDGALVMHISNRYFELEGPLGRIAEHLGLHALFQHHIPAGGIDLRATPSKVVVLSKSQTTIDQIATTGDWGPLDGGFDALWTDDHAYLLSVLTPH